MPTILEKLAADAIIQLGMERGLPVFPEYEKYAFGSAIPSELAVMIPAWKQTRVLPLYKRNPDEGFKLLASYAFETTFATPQQATYAVTWAQAIAETKLWQENEALLTPFRDQDQQRHQKLTILSERLGCTVDEIPGKLSQRHSLTKDDIEAVQWAIDMEPELRRQEATIQQLHDDAVHLCGYAVITLEHLAKDLSYSRKLPLAIQNTIESYYQIPAHRQRLTFLALSQAKG